MLHIKVSMLTVPGSLGPRGFQTERERAMYYMVTAHDKAGEVVTSQAIMSYQIEGAIVRYHEQGGVVECRTHKIEEEEFLQWVQKRTGYEGHLYGRPGEGQR